MKILVMVKQVPDTATQMKIGADGRAIDTSGITWIVSPYDEFALEEALRIKEAKGAGTVTVVSVGPERTKTGLRECLARGADEAIWIDATGVPYLDALGTAKALAAVAKGGAYDFYWFGQKAVGPDEGLVGPMFAELAGVPHVASIVKLEVGDGKVTAHREIEGAHEVVECSLPAALTAQKGLNEPRYASLKGIMAAKKKPIVDSSLATLGVTTAQRVKVTTLEAPPARKAGIKVQSVEELVAKLHNEAKVL